MNKRGKKVFKNSTDKQPVENKILIDESEDAAESKRKHSNRQFKLVQLSSPPSESLRNEGRILLSVSAISLLIVRGVKIKEVGMFDIKAEVSQSSIQVFLWIVTTFLLLSFLIRCWGEFQEHGLKIEDVELPDKLELGNGVGPAKYVIYNGFIRQYKYSATWFSATRTGVDIMFPVFVAILAVRDLTYVLIELSKTL